MKNTIHHSNSTDRISSRVAAPNRTETSPKTYVSATLPNIRSASMGGRFAVASTFRRRETTLRNVFRSVLVCYAVSASMSAVIGALATLSLPQVIGLTWALSGPSVLALHLLLQRFNVDVDMASF